MRTGYGYVVELPVRGPLPEPPCRSCGCARDDHSRVLVDAPCLDCAPCSFYVAPGPALSIIRGESELIGARRRRRPGTSGGGPR